MGRLRAEATGTVHPLLARTLLGRSPACAIRLTDGLASGEHALLSYAGLGWELRDLGSKNGTFVDGARIDPGQVVQVPEGAVIGFGQNRGWTLEDAGAPPLLAVDLATAEVVSAIDGVLALPSEQDPQISIYESNRGEYTIERTNEAPRRLSAAEVVSVSGRVFRVEPPDIQEGTPFAGEGPTVDNVTFRFQVSRNEEYVDLVLLHGGREIPIPRREHLYVLLTLARLRANEIDQPIDERGWINREALLKMLAMEPNSLDVAIYRARQQLSRAGIERAAGIVEVRPGQRRICTDRIEII